MFSNGIFDLLHAGHVECLEAARELGKHLVVGINSDASTRRLKGSGRPIQSERDRARIVAGLRCVDAVTIFAEDTPEALIEALRPDVLVKGADYATDDVVGRDTVLAGGGEVCVVPLVPAVSTSELIERIRRLPRESSE